MKITITKEDIDIGHKHDPERCAVARALTRAGVSHFGVMLTSVVVADGYGHVTGLPLPTAVTDWILNFDGNKPVAPISFDLTTPSETQPNSRWLWRFCGSTPDNSRKRHGCNNSSVENGTLP